MIIDNGGVRFITPFECDDKQFRVSVHNTKTTVAAGRHRPSTHAWLTRS